MLLPISLGLALNQPLAVMLDRILVEIALHRYSDVTKNSRGDSLVDACNDLTGAFERFSDMPEAAALRQSFRNTPLCFAPVLYSPGTFYDATELAACFAYRIGKLLEERLDMPPAVAVAPIVTDSGFLARIEELTYQTGELLRSGDFAMLVLAHRVLLRTQTLCALLARFRQLRALTHSVPPAAAPVLTEPPLR